MTTNFKPGDLIAVKKSHLTTHFGTYIENGWVIDASPKRRSVGYTSLAEFAGPSKVFIVPHTSIFSPSVIVARAKEHIGKPYRLFSQNCEHFVNDVYHGNPRSNQVVFATIIGLAVVMYFLVKKGGRISLPA